MSFLSDYPAGTPYAAILDTNAYRSLFKDLLTPEIIEKVRLLREAETTQHIQAAAPAIAALELIGSLVEGDEGFNYAECLTGILGLSHHCHENDEVGPRIIPHSFLLIAYSFFMEKPDDVVLDVKNVGGVITDLKTDTITAVKEHKNRNTFEDVKTWLQTNEQQFAGQIDQLVKDEWRWAEANYPNLDMKQRRKKILEHVLSEEMGIEISGSIIADAAVRLRKELSKEDFIGIREALIQQIPLSVGFLKWVIYTMIHDNIDMFSKISRKKRWNWIWDYQVAFLISDVPLNNRRPFLVTGDDDIHEVLNEHGYGNRVMTLSDYTSRLGLDW